MAPPAPDHEIIHVTLHHSQKHVIICSERMWDLSTENALPPCNKLKANSFATRPFSGRQPTSPYVTKNQCMPIPFRLNPNKFAGTTVDGDLHFFTRGTGVPNPNCTRSSEQKKNANNEGNNSSMVGRGKHARK